MSTITISQLPNSGALTGTEVLPIVQSDATVKTTVQDIANLAGLSGTNFIYVAADGTDTTNATTLSAAYTTAKTMSPSATNRITIVAAPGYYNFGNNAFIMDTQYIDLVSLDGNRSVIFNSANSGGTISITVNNVFVKGVNTQAKNFTIGSALNLIIIENCKGGDYSFGGNSDASGFFYKCEGGSYSFGGYSGEEGIIGIASGTFIDCKGSFQSFGGQFGGVASGLFINCEGGVNAFSGNGGQASGTFNNCKALDASFGGGSGSGSGGAYGTFINCQGGIYSFGGTDILSGRLYYCRLTSGEFEVVSGSGGTYYCVDGQGNPNNQGFTPQNLL